MDSSSPYAPIVAVPFVASSQSLSRSLMPCITQMAAALMTFGETVYFYLLRVVSLHLVFPMKLS